MYLIAIIMRKSGALSSPCGYALLIIVITAVASWRISIIRGNHFFITFTNSKESTKIDLIYVGGLFYLYLHVSTITRYEDV